MPPPCPRMLVVQYGGASDETQSPSSRREASPSPARCWSASTRMPRASIAGPRSTTSRCPPIATPPPCNRFKTFTARSASPRRLATACRVTSVAMEATGRLLDPDLRNPRGPRHRGAARQRAARQERPGPKERCVGLRVAPRAPQRRLAARELPSRPTPSSRCARYLRHRQTLVRERGHLRPADAEGAGADEPPAPAGGQRHHRRHRPAHPARHRRRASAIPQQLAQHRDYRCQRLGGGDRRPP